MFFLLHRASTYQDNSLTSRRTLSWNLASFGWPPSSNFLCTAGKATRTGKEIMPSSLKKGWTTVAARIPPKSPEPNVLFCKTILLFNLINCGLTHGICDNTARSVTIRSWGKVIHHIAKSWRNTTIILWEHNNKAISWFNLLVSFSYPWRGSTFVFHEVQRLPEHLKIHFKWIWRLMGNIEITEILS